MTNIKPMRVEVATYGKRYELQDLNARYPDDVSICIVNTMKEASLLKDLLNNAERIYTDVIASKEAERGGR